MLGRLAVVAAALLAAACQVQRQPAPVGVRLLRVVDVARATDRAALSPIVWSPDGRRFAYGGRGGVWLHELGDAAGARVAPGEAVTAVGWSKTADTLAFVDRGRLWTLGLGGRRAERIEIPGVVTHLAWAPGGDRLAVAAVRPGEVGGALRLWVSGPGGAGLRAVPWTPPGRSVTTLGWFPDALHLFVGLAAPDGGATAGWWRVRVAYPDSRRLPDPARSALESVLSADGRWVAYTAEEAGVERAFAVRADGGGEHALSRPARRIAGLAWSTHGDKVAYGVMLGEARAEVYVAPLGGDAPLLVAGYRLEFPDPAAALSLVWSPDERRLAYGTNTGAMAGPVWIARFRDR